MTSLPPGPSIPAAAPGGGKTGLRRSRSLRPRGASSSFR